MKYIKGRVLLKLKYGPNRGTHRVYTDPRVFEKQYPTIRPNREWWTASKGEWIMANDGTVAMCLNRSELRDKKKPGRVVVVIRVVWGSYTYYTRKDGSTRSRMTFEPKRLANPHGPSSLSAPGTPRHGKSMTKKKRMFAYLCIAKGVLPYKAYMIAFGTISESTARYNAALLMSQEEDKLVMAVADIYKGLFDAAGITQDKIVEIIKDELNSKHAPTRLQALKLALELRGEKQSGINVNVQNNQGMISGTVPVSNELPSPPNMQQLEAPRDTLALTAPALNEPAEDESSAYVRPSRALIVEALTPPEFRTTPQ